MSMNWDASELEDLARTLGSAGVEVGRMADMAVRKAGLGAVAQAQATAPVDTGFHRASIGMDVLGPAAVEFGPASNYGAHLEFGTHRMAPRPHIMPAADTAAEQLAAAMEALGVAAASGTSMSTGTGSGTAKYTTRSGQTRDVTRAQWINLTGGKR